MREILFRGKRCDNGEWVQGFYVRADHHWHNCGIHKDWIIEGASANGGWFALHKKYPVRAESIGQYTGLTDKNGKKIFEGDIVSFNRTNALGYINKRVGEVKYYNELPVFYILATTGDAWDWCDCFNIEAIGNIHDNPDDGGADNG